MGHSPEQLQGENERLAAQCQGLEGQLADLQKDYERVARSEARYRQVIENLPISIIFASPDGQLTEANAAFEKQFGFKIGDLQRSGFNLFTDPRLEANGKRSYMLRVLAGETVIEPPTNFYNLSPLFGEEVSARYIPGQGHYFPIRNERGEVQEIVEMSRSVTDLLEAQAEVQAKRDRAAQEKNRLLSSVTQVANLLLRAPNYTQILPDVVRLLGEAAGSDRCCFITAKSEPESGRTRREVLSEWQSATTLDWTEAVPVLYWEDFGDDLARLARGEVLNYLADEQEEPTRSLLQAQAITSVLYVPIITTEGFSGEIGFENCGEPRLYGEAEIAILQTAADSIAASIDRDCTQKVMLQLEQARSAELAEHNRVLQGRELILEVTATAANALLIAENLDEAVNRALQTIGECLEADRVNVIEIEAHDASSNPSQVRWRILNEWHSSHAVSQRLHPEHWQGDHTGIESWLEHFASGQSLSRLLEEMPEPFRSGQAAIGVKSYHTVPIFVAGRHWGNLGIDDCREAKRRDPADLTVLRTAAAFIGSAIQRDRTQIEILQAEQKRAHELERVNDKLQQALENLQARDLLLTTVAEVTKNLLDSSSNDLEQVISIALQMLGERIGCDRINVLENCGQPSTELPDYKIVYEWASSGTLQQISHPNHEGLSKSFVEQYLQNDGFGGLVDEWPEPIRSTFKALNIQSSYSVPIWLGEEFWGVIAFDYCQEARQISPSTVAVLKTAAACIGGVIQRDRNQKAILQAEEVRALELEQFNTELQQAIGNLQARDRILRVTAEVANNLLTRDDLNAAVNSALQSIGESLDTDRIAVLEFEHFNDAVDPSKIGWEILYEWHSAHTVSQLHSEQCLGTFEALEFILEDFSRMQSISYLLEELPEPFRSGQAAIGVKALHGVPILVEGRLWGSLGIDDCRNAKHRDLSELAVLKTVAACIGSAIQRDRTQLAMLQVEQVRAVELDKTNQTLKKSLNRLAANPDLNPFLGYVLLEITQQLDLDFAALRLYDAQAQTLPLELQVLNGQIKYRSEVIAPEAYLNLSIDDIPNWDQWLQTQQPLMVNLNAADDLVYLQDSYNYQARQLQLQVVINILLTLGETPIGYLALGSTQPTSFTAEELSLAKALAQQATLAIQLSQLLEEVKQSVLFEERNRVARDIHDTLAQTLGGIVIQLQAAKFFSPLNPAESMKHMMTARDLAKEGLAEARRSVWTLCEDGRQYQDLAATISEVSQQLTAYDPVQANIIVQGEPYLIEPDLGLNLLRIAQESINNVVRHAQTTTLTVHLTYEPFQISLTIQDKGCGFDPDMPIGGFGLAGIQQRCDRLGAEFKLTSTKGKGTTVQIKCATVPVRMPSL
ncbi:MAG: GAF domain-containing protein [Cyanobacteria bacterium P01_H01_bin.15]